HLRRAAARLGGAQHRRDDADGVPGRPVGPLQPDRNQTMSEFDVIVRGGTVVTASETMRADVGVKDGRIVALAERLTGSAARVVDATGRYVMPGGIDSHCHIEQPSSTGGRNAESWESGTRSAACGGTTTVIAFSSQEKGEGVL